MTYTVTEKGTVTIPVEVRRKLRLTKGSQVDFVETDGGVLMVPIIPLERLKGIDRDKRKLVYEMIHEIQEERQKKPLNKNKHPFVLDTGILYLYFSGDRRAVELFNTVNKGTVDGFTCEPNAAELYYKTCQKLGRDTALIRYTSLRHSSLVITAPDERLTLHAGELMCSYRNQLSLTDAYIVSFAKYVRGNLFTTDPRIANLKIVPTEFFELK